MYIPKAYPCWLYHASEPARIVDTHDERELLGDEWATHPDLVPAPAPVGMSKAGVLTPNNKTGRKAGAQVRL